MRIKDLPESPVEEVNFWNAERQPPGPCLMKLPILHGNVDRLPEGYDAVVVTSDLQGREDSMGTPGRLLGEVLPAILREVVLPKRGVAPNARVAAWLAGDFYTLPSVEKRGGTGDVQDVWAAFASAFDRVIGVPGNHDLFHGSHHPRALPENASYLDGAVTEMGSLKIAGLGGIIGKPTKPHRRAAEDFQRSLDRLINDNPDVLLMHDGPGGVGPDQSGIPGLWHSLLAGRCSLVVRGHRHWNNPLAELSDRLQVLNVEGRVVILTA